MQAPGAAAAAPQEGLPCSRWAAACLAGTACQRALVRSASRAGSPAESLPPSGASSLCKFRVGVELLLGLLSPPGCKKKLAEASLAALRRACCQVGQTERHTAQRTPWGDVSAPSPCLPAVPDLRQPEVDGSAGPESSSCWNRAAAPMLARRPADQASLRHAEAWWACAGPARCYRQIKVSPGRSLPAVRHSWPGACGH